MIINKEKKYISYERNSYTRTQNELANLIYDIDYILSKYTRIKLKSSLFCDYITRFQFIKMSARCICNVKMKYIRDFDIMYMIIHHTKQRSYKNLAALKGAKKYYEKADDKTIVNDITILIDKTDLCGKKMHKLCCNITRNRPINFERLKKENNFKEDDEVLAKYRKDLGCNLQCAKVQKEIQNSFYENIILTTKYHPDEKENNLKSSIFKHTVIETLYDLMMLIYSDILAANNIKIVNYDTYKRRIEIQENLIILSRRQLLFIEDLNLLSDKIVVENNECQTLWYIEMLENAARVQILLIKWHESDVKNNKNKVTDAEFNKYIKNIIKTIKQLEKEEHYINDIINSQEG